MTKSEQTKLTILEAGMKLWPKVTARAIARKIGLTHSAIAYHYTDDLQDAVATHAVETGDSRVIAQLIAANHKAIKKLTKAERMKHLKAMV